MLDTFPPSPSSSMDSPRLQNTDFNWLKNSIQNTSEVKVKQRRGKNLTPEEREAKRIERIMRNRHSAVASRERKRKRLEELEVSHSSLLEDSEQLRKRLKTYETENANLTTKLETLTTQFETLKNLFTLATTTNNNSQTPSLESILSTTTMLLNASTSPVTPSLLKPDKFQCCWQPFSGSAADNIDLFNQAPSQPTQLPFYLLDSNVVENGTWGTSGLHDEKLYVDLFDDLFNFQFEENDNGKMCSGVEDTNKTVPRIQKELLFKEESSLANPFEDIFASLGRGSKPESEKEELKNSEWYLCDKSQYAFSLEEEELKLEEEKKIKLVMDFNNVKELSKVESKSFEAIVIDWSTWRYLRPLDEGVVKEWQRMLNEDSEFEMKGLIFESSLSNDDNYDVDDKYEDDVDKYEDDDFFLPVLNLKKIFFKNNFDNELDSFMYKVLVKEIESEWKKFFVDLLGFRDILFWVKEIKKFPVQTTYVVDRWIQVIK
ncbi:hypothetical protein HK099_007874 [Clydaea vesicula]|uniref:BZIP domain-containing protein n=1 Tax=Clydaea vesicula TaxID=447962 RepID=A0AAD5TWP0_9FUNG|nr:hypothetical protein HK099_007874 [Clydaea vesicula]